MRKLFKSDAKNFLGANRSFWASCLAQAFAALLIFIISYSSTAQASQDFGIGRVRNCSVGDEGNVSVEGLDWNPSYGGKDVDFVMSNPVCLSFALTSYASVKAAIALMNYACGTGSGVPRITPTPILDFYDIGKATIKGSGSPSCVSSIVGATASLGTAVGLMSVTYGIAKGVFNNSNLCGAEWMRANDQTKTFSTSGYKQEVENQINAWIRDGNTENLNFDNKTYREWYYGGVEVVDSPDGDEVCYDVTQPKVDNNYPKQKYYLKGSETGNYNCKKYLVQPGQNDPLNNQPLTEARRVELQAAYDCCIRRSSKFVCIEYDPAGALSSERKFCRAGSKCDLRGITFATKFIDNDRQICAETYSLCPYNFSLSGGTEYCNYYKDGKWNESEGRWKMITPEQLAAGDCVNNSEIRNADCTYNSLDGKCDNYCQYLTHCTRTSSVYPYNSGLSSPYFSEACLNFVGDSQNRVSYNAGFILGSQRHFSAPIAQCVKETLENVFYNRAGHSKCLNVNEYPSAGGICPSGLYVTDGSSFTYKKGNPVKTKSFFTTIQDNLQFAVKLVLTMSIMFYGMNLLLSKNDIRQKKDIMVFILKIALVSYFATGDAWQSMFFRGVYGASSEFSRMVFKIKVGEREEQRDGCQFGKIYLEDGTETFSPRTYPEGKEYLAIWDTLDCKIMRYLGFGPEVSAANIVMLILASFLTGPIGIYFALSVMIFGILLIAATLRALHIFLSSAISIIIMVFISPIVIPLALFEKTKSIYEGWLKELISFCLQPMILFAYIAIFIMVMDKTLIGSAEFSGDFAKTPFRTINCEKKCANADGSIVPYVDGEMPQCDQTGQKIIDPLNDSVACLLSFDSFGQFPGFEIIGISIPIVLNLFESHVKERVLTLLKGALVMFIIYKFMDEIPGITSALIGGTKLPTSNADGISMFKKTLGMARAIQERLARGALKHGKNAAGKAREGVRGMATTGKKNPDAEEESSDKTADSASSSSSKTGSSSSSSSDKSGSSSGPSSSDKTGSGAADDSSDKTGSNESDA